MALLESMDLEFYLHVCQYLQELKDRSMHAEKPPRYNRIRVLKNRKRVLLLPVNRKRDILIVLVLLVVV